MAVEIKLPQFGMGMSAGMIVKWLKQVGERVEIDEPLLEVEAEKSNVEVVAPASGILTAILAEEGVTVPVYDVIGTIDAQ